MSTSGNSPTVFLKQDNKAVQKSFQSNTSLFLTMLPQHDNLPNFYLWYISVAQNEYLLSLNQTYELSQLSEEFLTNVIQDSQFQANIKSLLAYP